MTNNKAREINSPLIEKLINETSPEELAKIDTEMTNNKQQTAVELFAIALYGFLRGNGDEIQKLLEEFNEMQKQQHATTWDAAIDNFKARGENYVRAWVDFDEYYNETY